MDLILIAVLAVLSIGFVISWQLKEEAVKLPATLGIANQLAKLRCHIDAEVITEAELLKQLFSRPLWLSSWKLPPVG